MKLIHRLFGSHLAIVLLGLLVLIAVTSYLAPLDFSARMQHSGAMMGRGHDLVQGLEEEYRNSLNQAFLISSAVGIIFAVLMSWLLSQNIIKPLRMLVAISHKIADGDYEQRLDFKSHDELGELVQSFNRMAESLASMETMRRELLADVSHELKTPLASIKAYMEGLEDELIPANPETYQTIYREASRLERLVMDLQELSRTEAHSIQLNIRSVNLNELLKHLVERFSPQYQEKYIQLYLQTIEQTTFVQADSDRVEQVLTNILGNALQYTPEYGEVSIRIENNTDSAVVAIQDTGIGLDETAQRRIFQRFYRVDKSRARISGGSGIGLTIAKSLIEAQGGKIWLESAGLGKGTCFYIQIPKTV